MKIPCSVEILTLNSEKTLPKCLESVKNFDDVIVIDGNSTDKTVAIAKSFGARVFPQSDSKEDNIKISDFSLVRNKGIAHAKNDWFLFIDSDEYLSEEAVEEIKNIVRRGEINNFFVYKLPRKYIINGEIIDRSSMYPNYQVRFFFLPAVDGFVKKIHEKIRVKKGYKTGTLQNPEYVPFDDWRILKKKWKSYARHQVLHIDPSFKSLMRFSLQNLVTFSKYVLKYLLTFILGSGKRMPFVYEWLNMTYHLDLIMLAWKRFLLPS